MADEQSEIESRQEYKVTINIEFRVLSDCFPFSIARDLEKHASDMIAEKNEAGQSIRLKSFDPSTGELDEFESDMEYIEEGE